MTRFSQVAAQCHAIHGSQPLLVECFSGPESHAGPVSKVTNWQLVGDTKGYSLNPPRVLLGSVPLTTQLRESRCEVKIGKLPTVPKRSYANVQGVGRL